MDLNPVRCPDKEHTKGGARDYQGGTWISQHGFESRYSEEFILSELEKAHIDQTKRQRMVTKEFERRLT